MSLPPVSGTRIPVERIPFTYTGTSGEIFSLWFVSLLLRIVTLGIYGPWAKTRLRRYVTQHFKADDEPFLYSGTGPELLKGMIFGLVLLIAIGGGLLFGTIVIVHVLVGMVGPNAIIHCIVFLPYPLFILLFHVARYLGLRYRLSRLSYMGIRFRLTGSAFDYFLMRAKWFLLNIVTLGFFIPQADIAIRTFVLNNIHLGDFRIQFRADARPINDIHWKTWLLAIPTLGLSRFWYRAALYRLTAKATQSGNVRFRTSIEPRPLLRFTMANSLIAAATFGLAVPWILHRKNVFLAQNLILLRRKDQNIQPQQTVAQASERQGEGLDAFLGDGGFGL